MHTKTMNMFAETNEDMPIISGMARTELTGDQTMYKSKWMHINPLQNAVNLRQSTGDAGNIEIVSHYTCESNGAVLARVQSNLEPDVIWVEYLVKTGLPS